MELESNLDTLKGIFTEKKSNVKEIHFNSPLQCCNKSPLLESQVKSSQVNSTRVARKVILLFLKVKSSQKIILFKPGGEGGGGVTANGGAVPDALEENAERGMFFRGGRGTRGSRKGRDVKIPKNGERVFKSL